MIEGAGIDYQDASAAPGLRFYAIGDVHGRADLLSALFERITGEIARDRPDDWRIVFLGDYVDRGAWSRQTLDLLAALVGDERILALRGNHDQGFLDFLADPHGAHLFRSYGGAETAASYGVEADFGTAEATARTHRALVDAVPAAHRAFLDALPVSVEIGDFFLCHAGIRPGIALERQVADDLMWIRSEFLDWPHLHPKVVVHGHTPSRQPQIRPNRVGIDTMAYTSGTLTAFAAEGKRKWLIEATGA